MKRVVSLVSGYDHDPADPKHSPSRDGGCYTIWKSQLPHRHCEGLNWYSGRLGIKGYFKALFDGFNWRGTYVYAYDVLALRAAKKLVERYQHYTVKPDVICHSLGSRVVLKAMEECPNMFNKVIFFNGANLSEEAECIIRQNPHTKILNVCVKEDDVLSKMGGLFAPKLGYDGTMGQAGLNLVRSNFEQVFLDMPHEKYAKYDLRGDNPDSYGDHSYSYEYLPNWDLYRDFLQ